MTIYVIMLFVEQYISDLGTRDQLGYVTIGIAASIFIFNLIPIICGTLVNVKRYLKTKCGKNNQWKTKYRDFATHDVTDSESE